MQQTLLFFASPPSNQALNPPALTIKKKSGRPSTTLTESDLKECISYYFEKNPNKKQQLLARYGKKKLKDALNIFKIDYGKHGVLSRTGCPLHKKTCLGYVWHGYASGARIKCLMPDCAWTTHFEPMLYHTDVANGKGETVNYDSE